MVEQEVTVLIHVLLYSPSGDDDQEDKGNGRAGEYGDKALDLK